MADDSFALNVSPESELTFSLSRSSSGVDATPRCTLKLTHPGNSLDYLAFKVKTTQPRRYLVRPNQGLVAPGSEESISILLVEKDKQVLLQSYDRLGQTALDHSKDKFLVQSCCVSKGFATSYNDEKKRSDAQKGDVAAKSAKELAEALTGMWNAVTSGGDNPVFNKKLHVRHVVAGAADRGGVANNKGSSFSSNNSQAANPPVIQHEKSLQAIENMSSDQMFSEVSTLRRKYDELVSFSVNLTAERDILNNTLEQTKRDLNREMTNRAALENKGGPSSQYSSDRSRAAGAPKSGTSSTVLMVLLLLVAVAMFLTGVKLANSNQVNVLAALPVIGGMLMFGEGDAAVVDATMPEL